ncbi:MULTISPECIES: hypothetical protein [Pseudomonadaceae]|uniref:hypothetical protein n=1 Tax=Pseudomonadaceae TaxID=135621 RepID=UPI000D0B58AD|nr:MULTISPECIES: hypothetical protein [Pseudomonadaceae]AWL01010.1 hypothetical protein C6Y50_13965 [Stutzerimonas stutzeri]MCM1993603.1 hypothetical protein [Pseudomonas aeruginosa]MCM2002050.1 hypothetical protein [Pseudomonas aeruginosa]MCM2007003.1 hypothetical protein [Pseudomonas aeruginosa]MCM2016000.1 hypothetical protein [Pseudomonas aeruginosa]
MAPRITKEGPDLPPLTPDLRHTPADAIHNLFGAVFMQALQEQDREWVESPDYLLIADFAGIDLDLAERVRRMFLAGQIKPGAFAGLAPAKPPESLRWGTCPPAQPSTTIRPVEMVRAIAATMPDAKPSEVIRACIAAGVNPATAATQVRKYRKALAESNN